MKARLNQANALTSAALNQACAPAFKGARPEMGFFPLRSDEATMLKEGVSNHCHEGVTVKALPGASLEVVEAEFFF